MAQQSQQAWSFGNEVRRLRAARGMSLNALAVAVHYSKSQLSKVERGIQGPGADLVRLCDAVLGANGALIALAQGPCTAGALPAGVDQQEEVWVMHVSAQGQTWYSTMNRREVLAAAVAAGGGGLVPGAAAAGADPGAGQLLETSRQLFGHFRRMGQAVPPGLVLPALVAQTGLLEQASARTSGATRVGLLRLASRYAEYTGWLVQESGDDKGALQWTARAVALARAGQDHDLAAYAQVRRALVAMYRGDAAQTIALARRAQDSGLPPRIRGLAAQREAQGHALAGDHTASMRCLDRARALLGADPDRGATALGSTHLEDPVAMATGWCLVDLGRPAQAAAVLDAQVSALPGDATRVRARFGVRQALAHAAAGDPEQACALLHPVLDAVNAVESATVAADLRRLAAVLSRHRSCTAVRNLEPALSASLYTTPM